MNMTDHGLRALGSALCLALAGCAAAPAAHDERTAPALPAQWPPAGDAAAQAVTEHWWRSFGSAELDRLVQLAGVQSQGSGRCQRRGGARCRV